MRRSVILDHDNHAFRSTLPPSTTTAAATRSSPPSSPARTGAGATRTRCRCAAPGSSVVESSVAPHALEVAPIGDVPAGRADFRRRP